MGHLGRLRRWPHGYLIRTSRPAAPQPPRADGGVRRPRCTPRKSAAGSYGWPLKPFDRQHPVRGFFGDPRIGEAADGHVESKTFHFGIDISAPDGTAVYATTSGPIVWEPQRPETIAVRTADGRVFAYWHIVPAVHNGQYAVAYKTVLGHISKGWGHVHLAELVGGRYVNPLRRGATRALRRHDAADGAYVQLRAKRQGDRTHPSRRTVRSRRRGRGRDAAGRARALGRQAGHAGSCPLAARRQEEARRRWRTAVDFSRTIPPPDQFDAVYAPWTRQNHAWRAGRYRVQLAAAGTAAPGPTAAICSRCSSSTPAATARLVDAVLGRQLTIQSRNGS